MGKNPLLIAVALLAILASLVWLYLNRSDRAPNIQLDSYQALGQVAAQETARLLNHQGRVVIIAPSDQAGSNPAERATLGAFSRALKKQGQITLAGLELLELDPMEQMSTGGSVPRERFLQVLQAHPNADALVLFAGFPALDPPDFDRLKRGSVKIIVVAGHRPAYQQLLDARWIHLAIVPRSAPADESSPPPRSLQEWFDRDYQVLR